MSRTHYFFRDLTSDLSGGADFNKVLSREQGTDKTLVVSVAASSTETSFGFTEVGDPGPRGSVGKVEWRTKVGVQIAAGGTLNLRMRIRRISSTGTILASGTESANQLLNTTGVKTYNFLDDLGVFSETDRIRVDYIFQNTTGGALSVTLDIDNTLDTELNAPWSAPLLSTASRRALQKTTIKGSWIVEMDLPGGTIRGSMYGQEIPGVGSYPPNVLSLSKLPFGVPLNETGMDTTEVTCSWADPDYELVKIVEGENGDDVKGSPVRVKFAIDGVSESDWVTRYTGILKDHKFSPYELKWTLRFGYDDRVLNDGLIPRLLVMATDFPNAPGESYTKPLPQCYGIWDSLGLSNKGAWPTIPVGYVPQLDLFCYLVAHGRVNEIIRVYSNGNPLNASAWSTEIPFINGHEYSLIGFTTDQLGATITCDVKGYFISTVIERPGTILQHWISNFVEGDYQGGSFSTGIPDLLSQDGLSQLLLDYELQFDFVGALRIAQQRSPIGHLDEMLSSWNYRAYWNGEGKIVVKPMDHRPVVTYMDWPWARGMSDELGDLSADYETKDLVDRIQIQHTQDGTTDNFAANLEVRDPNLDRNVSDTVQMFWGAAKIL